MPVRIDKLSRGLMRRSIRLIDMEYKPSEIAEELGASKEQVLRLVSVGAPARKDARGHYWIHGLSFAKWLVDAAPKKDGDRRAFSDDETYCVTCRKVISFTARRRIKNIIHGTCPDGHKVARFMSQKRKAETK